MLQLSGPPEQAAAQLIAHLQAKGILGKDGELETKSLSQKEPDPEPEKGHLAGSWGGSPWIPKNNQNELREAQKAQK